MTHGLAIAVLFLPALAAVGAGLWHLEQTLSRAVILSEDLAIALAWLFPVGALVWLEAYLTGSRLLGFAAPWTWLTAAHFAAAGFGALTITGYVARMATTARTRYVMHLALAAHPLAFTATAAGIAGVPHLDELGATAYVLLFSTQAAAYLLGIAPRRPLPGSVLGAALLVPVATLLPAAGWAWGRPLWGLDEMVRYHGLVNAVGHVGLGLVALAWLRPARRLPRLAAPLSRLHSRGPVSAAFIDACRDPGARAVSGLTARFGAYDRTDFHTSTLPPDIADFYENTSRYDLEVVGRWYWPFRIGGWLWTRVVAPRLGQLALPRLDSPPEAGQLQSELVKLDDAGDGRRDVRGWIRRWRHSRRTLYFAAYAEHVREGVRYMNIAFPLPGANLTSILHLVPAGRSGLDLTSRHHVYPTGDQGVYLVVRGRAAKRPSAKRPAPRPAAAKRPAPRPDRRLLQSPR